MNQCSLTSTAPGAEAPRRLEVIYRAIDDLKPDPKNPRQHSKKQIRQLAGCIKALGFNSPVMIDRDDKLISGHARLAACCELGLKEIATIRLDHLDEAQQRAFMIADNRLAETATWDDRVLGEHLRDLARLELDFSLEVTGFEIGEIDLRIALLDGQAATDDPADAGVEPAATTPVSKRGDVWLLDRHRIGCGSILDLAAVQTLVAEDRAAMVFTDPPYNVPIDGHATGLGQIHHRSFAMAAGERGLVVD
jgi:hypothetical protein